MSVLISQVSIKFLQCNTSYLLIYSTYILTKLIISQLPESNEMVESCFDLKTAIPLRCFGIKPGKYIG